MPILTLVNAADTAWILVSTALVLLMTPALGFFYAGMVGEEDQLAVTPVQESHV